MELLNTDLLRRPTNWLVVGTMVILALFALHFSLALIHGNGPIMQQHPSRVPK